MSRKKTLLMLLLVLIITFVFIEFLYLTPENRQNFIQIDITKEEAMAECPSLAYSEEIHQWMLGILETVRDENLEDGNYSLEEIGSTYRPVKDAFSSYVKVEHFDNPDIFEVPRCSCEACFLFENDNKTYTISHRISGTNTNPIEDLDESTKVDFGFVPIKNPFGESSGEYYYANHTDSTYWKGVRRHEWFWLIKREIRNFLYR